MLLQYKNGRFHLGEISFHLPDGALIDLTPQVIGKGVTLCQADRHAVLAIFHQKGELPIDSMLKTLLDCLEGNSGCLEEIKTVTVNGLEGYQVIYHLKNEEYFERYLSCQLEGCASTLVITLETRRPLCLKAVLDHPDLHTILSSIQADACPRPLDIPTRGMLS